MKKAKTNVGSFTRRDVFEVKGFKLSDGQIISDYVQAQAMQAKLDLKALVVKELDLEEGYGSDTEGFDAFTDFVLRHRDILIDLFRAAFMTPSEIDEKLDDHKRALDGPLFSPAQNIDTKNFFDSVFDEIWVAVNKHKHRPSGVGGINTIQFRDNLYLSMRRSGALRYSAVIDVRAKPDVSAIKTEQLDKEQAASFFEAGFVAAQAQTGKSCARLFADHWNTLPDVEVKKETIDVAYLGHDLSEKDILKEAMHLYDWYRENIQRSIPSWERQTAGIRQNWQKRAIYALTHRNLLTQIACEKYNHQVAGIATSDSWSELPQKERDRWFMKACIDVVQSVVNNAIA